VTGCGKSSAADAARKYSAVVAARQPVTCH